MATQNHTNIGNIGECEEITINGTVIEQCLETHEVKDSTTDMNAEDAIIIATDDEPSQEFKSVSIQTYDKNAVRTFVNSLNNPKKQKKLKKSYNDIIKSVYFRDDESAIQRKATKRRKFVVSSIESVPTVVSTLAKSIVTQFPADKEEDKKMFEAAIQDLINMAKEQVDFYGDDMSTISLNTRAGEKSTFLAALLALKRVTEDKMEIGVLMHMEEWNLKKGWKINGKCQKNGEMCWDSVKIGEFLEYQMFQEYVQEIDQ